MARHHKHLDTPYHQQDTNYYCGAACAQMVLDTLGVGLIEQDELYADNHSHSTIEGGWYTAPDGLQWTLNNYQSHRYFALDALDSEDAISRKIVWTIHHYEVAPVAMVFGSAHWIAVRGYTTTGEPRSSDDTHYTIHSLDVNNPWPPTPSPGQPPPHAHHDGCGSGGVRGVANEHLSYAAWRADYMTGINFGYWNGKFVAICDPSPPPERLPEEPPPAPARHAARSLLSDEAAAKHAREALRNEGLDRREDWSYALKSARAGQPILVQRLDRLDSFYWIVPLTRQRRPAAAVSVDARSGGYRQAMHTPEPSAGMFGYAEDSDVLKRVVNGRFELPDGEGRLVVRREAASVYPHYVWSPCLESLSPFYPFRMVTVGQRQLFVRGDGEVFTALTLGIHGA
ncbi:MAG: C39 family peptidase [Solirubrobacteraceae bacterium]